MGKRIVYQLPEQPVAVLIPCDCGLTLKQIGQKDVPVGVPFWTVDAAELPADRAYRNAWRLDPAQLGEPAGIGGTCVTEARDDNA
jgi:hypothetical protein